MATALNVQISKPVSEGVADMFSTELRLRQQSIAEITEMIHVRFLLILYDICYLLLNTMFLLPITGVWKMNKH